MTEKEQYRQSPFAEPEQKREDFYQMNNQQNQMAVIESTSNQSLTDEVPTKENYKEVLTIAKEALKESYERRNRIEQRATQTFPVLSILMGIVAIILKEVIAKPELVNDYMFIVGVPALIISSITPIFVIGILWVKKFEVLYMSDELFERFTTQGLSQAYADIWGNLQGIVNKIHDDCDKKAKTLRLVHIATVINILLVAILMVIFTYNASTSSKSSQNSPTPQSSPTQTLSTPIPQSSPAQILSTPTPQSKSTQTLPQNTATPSLNPSINPVPLKQK